MLVGAGLLLVSVVSAASPNDVSPPATATGHEDPPPDVQVSDERIRAAEAAAVLTRWDRARAAAYAAQDREALASLYATGSAAGRADVALLDHYTAAGVRVADLRMQVLAVRVLRASAAELRLVVTDRVHTAHAVDPGGDVELPADEPSTRLIVLTRADTDLGWVVSAVRPRSDR